MVQEVGNYVVSKSYSGMDSMNYFHSFPTIICNLNCISLILLYNGSLG